MNELTSFDEVRSLSVGTVIKVMHPTRGSDFRVVSAARLDPYTNGECGVPCDREVSARGVHQVGPIFASDFAKGLRFFLATREEAHGREFSYGTEARF